MKMNPDVISMRKIFLFMMVSLDGFFEGRNHDLSWHNVDKEFSDFAVEQLNTIDIILFGRTTYEMMASFWPTETAKKADPETAKLMNNTNKIVFSRTLHKIEEKPDWKNVGLIKKNVVSEVEKLKHQKGKDIAIFGSSNLSVFLIKNNLIDEFRIMINPVIIGRGTRLFDGLNNKLKLEFIRIRKFKNGNVLLYYEPR